MQAQPKTEGGILFEERVGQETSSRRDPRKDVDASTKPSYVVVGVLCRVFPPLMGEVCECIDSLPGMESFSLGERGRVGVLIEAGSFDQAHQRLQEELLQVEGVQAAWPISTQWE